MTSLAVSAGQLEPGAAFTADTVVKNRGSTTAARSTVGFYLSRDARFDSGDTVLGHSARAKLKPGGSISLHKRLHIPAAATPGLYRLIACADVARRVRESNERNNCRASRVVRIALPPQDTSEPPTDGSPGPGSPGPGSPGPTPPQPGPQVAVTLDTPADGSQTNDATPSLSGSAAGGSFVTVTVSSGGATVQSLQAMPAPDGTWSVDAGALAEGAYAAQAHQTDAFGRTSDSSTHTFTVDLTPPVATVTRSPANPNGTNGFYTTSPTVTASADDGVSLAALSCTVDGAAATLTNTHATATHRDGVVPQGGDGTRNISCTATDAAGNAASAGTTVKVDSANPTISTSVSPASPNGTNGFYTSAVTVHASADDANLSGLACKLDGNSVSLTNESITGSHHDGDVVVASDSNSHSVSCTATDASGRSASSTASFAIDATAPASSLTATPAAPDGQNGWYLSAPTMQASADDANIAGFTCKVDGQGATLTNTHGSSTHRDGDVPLGGDGTHAVDCTATDSAGNATVTSKTVKVDGANPSISTTASPAPNGAGFNAGNVTVHVSADDANLTGLACTVDGSPASLGNLSVTPTHREGDVVVSGDSNSHAVSCSASDIAGRTSAPANRTIKIDATDPSGSLTVTPSTPDGQNGLYTSAPTVHASADDPNINSLACTVAGSPATLTNTHSSSTHRDGDVPLGGDGTRSVMCTATDLAGNSTVTSTTVTVDTLDPALTLSRTPSSPNGQNGWDTTAPTVHASADDANLDRLDCTVNGSAVTLTNQSSNANHIDGDVPLGGDGTRAVSCTATDDAGRTKTQALTVKVDSVNPSVAISLSPASPNGQNGWYTSTPTVSVSAGDANPTTLSCTRDGSAVTVTAGQIPAGGDGSHAVSCTATDSSGRTGSANSSYKIDTVAPNVGLTTPANGASTPLMSFSGGAGSATNDATTVTLKVYAGSSATGTPVQTQTASRGSGTTWSLTLSPVLADNATYTAQTEQTDAAGNTGVSAPHTFTVPPTLLAAGDIADCSSPGDEATAALVSPRSGTVATLGDNVYADSVNPEGSLANFNHCYDPSWGAFKARTRPAIGNHEYKVDPNANGYWDYFGTTAAGARGEGYYSYDVGTWHIIVLNTNDECTDLSCSAGSAQDTWLQSDLAAHTNQCTLAYFHHPRYSSYLWGSGSDSAMLRIWQVLYAANVDVILNGHAHTYERYEPLNASGTSDSARGIREFIVGTGGAEHHSLNGHPDSRDDAFNDDTFGILQLALNSGSYSWNFVPEAGRTFTDSGTANCH